MIDVDMAKTKAIAFVEGIRLVKGYELDDCFVFTTDYADNNGLITPNMPVLCISKETGKVDYYTLYDPKKKNPYESMDRLKEAKEIAV